MKTLAHSLLLFGLACAHPPDSVSVLALYSHVDHYFVHFVHFLQVLGKFIPMIKAVSESRDIEEPQKEYSAATKVIRLKVGCKHRLFPFKVAHIMRW